jgi:APA family basic amino acid/polyamine antiporter
LPVVTWIRFGAWLAAGLLIYFVYSVRHSRLQHSLNARKH